MTTLDFIVSKLEEKKAYISKREYKAYTSYRLINRGVPGYLDLYIPKPSAKEYWDMYEKAIRDYYYAAYANSWEFDDFLMALIVIKDKEEVNARIEEQND